MSINAVLAHCSLFINFNYVLQSKLETVAIFFIFSGT